MDNEAFNDADQRLLKDYSAVFRNPSGERVLKHLESLCRIRHTITLDEQRGKAIDPVRLSIEEGMRRVYWKIHAMVAAADVLGEEPNE